MTNYALSALVLVAITLSQSACAASTTKTFDTPASVLLKNQDGKYDHLNGIGKIFKNDMPVCTATLLDTRDKQNNATGPAYLLTAGHCIDFKPRPMVDLPFEASVTFNYFNDTPQHYKSYQIRKVNWSSLAGTDMAVMELTDSLDTLLKEGITPLKIASQRHQPISAISIVGAPDRLPQAGLRLATCTQEPTNASLVEDVGTFPDTLKNNCKDIRSGSSGSPVLDPKTGEITGVLFTSTFGSSTDTLCFDDTPCEVKNTQPHLSIDTHYSHNINYLSGCFVNGTFNSRATSCSLEPNFFRFRFTQFDFLHYAVAPDTQEKTPIWNLRFSLDTPYYRFKSVPDARQCLSPDNYSAAFETANAHIDAPTGRAPGMYFLCLVGVNSAEQTLSRELLGHAQILSAQLVNPSPTRLPELTITRNGDSYDVRWRQALPHFFNSYYYAGPKDSTDCANVDLKQYLYAGRGVTFNHDQLPLTLCSYNKNLLMKNSAIRTDLLQRP